MTLDDIDALLPQTQCGECGYQGCEPYAKALLNNEAEIDLCPPGGLKTLKALGIALKKETAPYEEAVRQKTRPPQTAHIKEAECIGCTKCIQACPVDAIIGSNKKMHTVIPHECTGCGLCVEPCPVDCIEMHEHSAPRFDPNVSRQRFKARTKRLDARDKKKRDTYQKTKVLNKQNDIKAKQDYIKALMSKKKKTPQKQTVST